VLRREEVTAGGNEAVYLLCVFLSLYSAYCLCINVYCSAATGCQPNCSYIYIYIYTYIHIYIYTYIHIYIIFADEASRCFQ
jgi:hypothetical protein